MQTVYLGHLQLAKVEPLFNQTKKWVTESRAPNQAAHVAQTMSSIPEDLASSPQRPARLDKTPPGSPLPSASLNLQPTPQQQVPVMAPLEPPSLGFVSGHTPAKTPLQQEAMLRASTGSPLPAYLHNTQILDPVNVKRLRSCLPSRFHSVDWELLYSTTLDGISINTYVSSFCHS